MSECVECKRRGEAIQEAIRCIASLTPLFAPSDCDSVLRSAIVSAAEDADKSSAEIDLAQRAEEEEAISLLRSRRDVLKILAHQSRQRNDWKQFITRSLDLSLTNRKLKQSRVDLFLRERCRW